MAIAYREWRDGDDLALLEIWGGPETEQARQFRGTLAPSGNALSHSPYCELATAGEKCGAVG